MIQSFSYKNKQIAIVIRKDYSSNDINFITENNLPQQVGYMPHHKGDKIQAHIHNNIKREISLTQETLIIRKGKVRLDLYAEDKKYTESIVLNSGDIAILIHGGHGLYCLEETEIIEIKQGPYLGADDKIHIEDVKNSEVKING